MKKTILTGMIMLVLIACSNETTQEQTVDSEAVKKIETVTNEVTEGTKKMEKEVDSLGEEIDELLNDI